MKISKISTFAGQIRNITREFANITCDVRLLQFIAQNLLCIIHFLPPVLSGWRDAAVSCNVREGGAAGGDDITAGRGVTKWPADWSLVAEISRIVVFRPRRH